ncbi:MULTISPECIES: type II toxin-antitoxin system VapC family toxin [unclassified Archaeoglobus]|jgi:predicted nucleic acid-binding protein|uniref:type II toxin-antitoxin system VapC family toxin n=1 Tax=unclassified Archaeoglobus TaxID=2643606 RepID=UPI0025C3F9AC|nr:MULTISPECIES: type II toxin-antitoxin system VapC family toxin [unclassified Archaeoglobus]
MEKIVVDASVVVKWFVEEEKSDEALKIRDAYINGKIKLIAPELIVFEVLNALYYKKLFSISELKDISEALEAYSMELYPLRGEYARKTLEVAFENNVTVYDAAYVSLAILKDSVMVTADRKLIDSLRDEYGVFVRGLEEF